MIERIAFLSADRLAKAFACAYFAIICFVGLAPNKAPELFGRTLLCLSITYAFFFGHTDFPSLLFNRRNVLLFFLVQLVGWALLIPVEYYAFEFSNFDTGIFANQVLLWKETGEYYTSVLGMHAFADHFTPNLLAFAPLYSLWNSFLWMPIVKVVAWAWSVYLLIGFSIDVLGKDSRYRYFVPGIYLLNQFVANTMLMEFQPSSLAMPFIILAFRLAYQQKLGLLLVVLVTLLGFKEHLGVVWISVGLFLALERQRPLLGCMLITIGAAEGLLVYQWLMPLFSSAAIHHDSRIAPLVAVGKKLGLMAQAVLSFGALPALTRYGLLYALPGFVLVLMGGDSVMIGFKHHYHDAGFALLACSSVLGLRYLKKLATSRSAAAKAVSSAIVVIVLAQGVRFPTYFIRREWPSSAQIALHQELETAKEVIKRYAPHEIWTLDHLGPYLFDQHNLKSLLNPELPPRKPEVSRRLVLVSSLVNTYPLTSTQYEALMSHLTATYTEMNSSSSPKSTLRIFISR